MEFGCPGRTESREIKAEGSEKEAVSAAWILWAHSHGELHTVMETPLEKALTTMVTTFHKYSGREGSKLTLSRKELKELIKKELCLGEMKESSIDDLMKSLDKNSDQEIDFKEYSVFLTTLCMAYNDFFLEDNK
ncbi:protein S100-A5 isoform X2 [Pongo pygmaeus]|nr:protein S100-A5 isoform X2 [Pongo abelii]